MFTVDQQKFLVRHLSQANVVLFAGAGFSTDAKNALGEQLPLSERLAADIWAFAGYDGPYDGTPLSEMYEALLTSGQTHAKIRDFLERRLQCREIPEYYKYLVSVFWYRLYTTNVDDLIVAVYRKEGSRLSVLSYPNDDMEDRDQSLGSIQLTHLNGRLPCSPVDLTFSPTQYAQAGNRRQPLYDQFIRDFVTRPVIFVGSNLNEPLFWQALESRRERARGISEHRPEAFLIAPRISQAKRAHLAPLNITPIEATTQEFLSWLHETAAGLPSRAEVLKRSAPDIAAVFESVSPEHVRKRDVQSFGNTFGPVPKETRTGAHRSVYLLGAAPLWEDLFASLDAPREISPAIVRFAITQLAAKDPALQVGAILGSAGAGKSTILRRVGLHLSQAGHDVYVTNSEVVPSPDVIARVVDALPKRVVLLFDNAEVALSQMPDILEALSKCQKPPIVLLASRTNDFDRLWGRTSEVAELREFPVPHLSRPEIKSIISILERQGLLGELRGKSSAERLTVFEEKAQKQILVAMREATSSKGFDTIIKDEFEKLVPEQAKLLYLIVALATDAGYRLSTEELVAAAPGPPAETLHLLARNLRDVVIATGANQEMFLLRHRLIAEVAIEQLVPRTTLRQAYTLLLAAVAPEIRKQHWRSRGSGLVKALLNHRTIYSRFRNDIDEARSIFVSVRDWFANNAHFWLQFGSLELEGRGGDLRLAENYLKQAQSLEPENVHVANAMGHVFFRKGVEASDFEEAKKWRDEAVKSLSERVEESACADAYAVHILGAQRFQWSRKWNDDNHHRLELEDLRILLGKAVGCHPRHNRLRQLKEVIDRAYLNMAIPPESRPRLEFPDLGV